MMVLAGQGVVIELAPKKPMRACVLDLLHYLFTVRRCRNRFAKSLRQRSSAPLGFNGESTMSIRDRFRDRSHPLIMHPAVFISGFLLVGLLFAMQSWLNLRMWYRHVPISSLLLVAAWELQYLAWGVLCWALWFWLGAKLQKADWKYLTIRLLPLSVLMSIGVEMMLVAVFPQLPISGAQMSFWQKVDMDLTDEFLGNMAIFWSAFLAFRALGYYEESRQKERALSQLAVELTQSQMQALRMQINPHFLFNTMNGISSLMQSDIGAADTMLEQLSSMLRISLDRGSKPLIRLGEEVEFIEMYLALQDRRYAGRVRQSLSVDPQLYDALVPSMLLQPLAENAYVHGLSRISADGVLEIRVKRDRDRLAIVVRNSGLGLRTAVQAREARSGIGLSNIRNRLQLQFQENQSLTIREVSPNLVQVDVSIPLIFSNVPDRMLVEYGAS
jgi:two-component system, LytTR family, sensor kinase